MCLEFDFVSEIAQVQYEMCKFEKHMENCSLRLTVFFCCCRLHDGVDFGRLYKMKNVSNARI